MEKLYRLVDHKTWKSLYIDEERIYLSSKMFSNPEDFAKHFPEKGILQPNKDSFPIKRIRGLEYLEGSTEILIRDADDKRKYTFADQATMMDLANTINEKRGFVESRVGVNAIYTFLSSIINLPLFIMVMCLVVYFDAIKIESGQEIKIRGKNALSKYIIAKVASLLGSKVTLALGIASLIWFVYEVYKGVKKPVKLYKRVWARPK